MTENYSQSQIAAMATKHEMRTTRRYLGEKSPFFNFQASVKFANCFGNKTPKNSKNDIIHLTNILLSPLRLFIDKFIIA